MSVGRTAQSQFCDYIILRGTERAAESVIFLTLMYRYVYLCNSSVHIVKYIHNTCIQECQGYSYHLCGVSTWPASHIKFCVLANIYLLYIYTSCFDLVAQSILSTSQPNNTTEFNGFITDEGCNFPTDHCNTV